MIVITDIGDVLVSVSLNARSEKIRQFQQTHNQELIGYGDIAPEWFSDYSRGRISTKRYLGGLSALFRVPENIIENAEASCIKEPNNELLYFLKEASKRVPISCLSNTHPIHWNVVNSLLPPAIFRHTLLSYELGKLKPDPAVFKIASKLLKAGPADIVYLDDDSANVEAAKALG